VSSNGDLWAAVLDELKLQMTEATFDAWLRNTIGTVDGDRLTVAVKSSYAKDWLENRLLTTVERTVARVAGRSLGIVFRVDGEAPSPAPPSTGLKEEEEEVSELDRDLPADCQFSVELVNFDPTTAGFVMTSNYGWQYWQPYLSTIEREHGARTRVAWALWNTLRAFPAAWSNRGRPEWPSIQTLADMVVCSRKRITGRASRGEGENLRQGFPGAIEILEDEHIVWLHTSGTSAEMIHYSFRVLDNLPLLAPAQVAKLTLLLQERHAREMARYKLDYDEWEQLTLSSLLAD